MIKLKDILMESYISLYYWMDPKGEFHKVDNESHAPWANEYLQTNNLPIINGNPMKSMYKLGWVRVGLVGYQGKRYVAYNYMLEFGLAPSAFRHLKNFAIERGADVMRDDTVGKVIDLDENVSEIKLPPPIGDGDRDLNESMSYKELLDASEKGRKNRASGVSVRSLPVSTERNAESWNFRYKANPSVTGNSWKGAVSFMKEVKSNQNAEDLDCHVDCECPDFKFRWAYADTKKDASQIGSNSLNKCINRAPNIQNPKQKPGLCKHLIALVNYLKTRIRSETKQNIFESLDRITETPNFIVEYYD